MHSKSLGSWFIGFLVVLLLMFLGGRSALYSVKNVSACWVGVTGNGPSHARA
jgi:hypothetical protein